MRVKDSIKTVIDKGIAAVVSSDNFQRTQFNFRRRHGSTIQVINIQPSAENMGNASTFYINIGIAFDELWQHFGMVIPTQPMEYDCHFRARLEQLFSDCPKYWVVSGDSFTTQFFKQVSRFGGREIASNESEVDQVIIFLSLQIRKAVSVLNQIDSPRTFLDHFWKDKPKGGNAMLNPLLAYVTGNLDEAWNELTKISKQFSDRPGMSVAELVNSLQLEKLKSRS